MKKKRHNHNNNSNILPPAIF